MPSNSELKESILAEIRRLAVGGKPPGLKRFQKISGFTEYQLLQCWPSWNDAVLEAGLEPNNFSTEKTSNDVLLRHLAELTCEFGKFPSTNQLKWAAHNKSGFPFDSTFRKAFGSKDEMIEALRAWAVTCNEFENIVPLLAIADSPVLGQQLNRVQPNDEVVEFALSSSYLPPVISCLSEMSRASGEALSACQQLKVNINSEFERRIAIAFELLGFSVESLGQGLGRNPDGIAKCFEQHWAVIYDAKVRTSPFRLVTEEERKFQEYIERVGEQLREQGIGKYYFVVVSSGFDERDIPKARELVRRTHAKACVLVEADVFMKLVEQRLRNSRDYSMNDIERKFMDTRILRYSDV